MNRTSIFILVTACLAGGLGYALSWKLHRDRTVLAAPHAAALVGRAAPPFQLPDLDGKATSLEVFRGRWVVVNFWASWCAPCRREMPALMDAYAQQDPALAIVVGIALDDAQRVRAFVQDLDIRYPVLVADDAAGMDLMRAYGNTDGLLPYSVLVDAQGQIRAFHLGELSADDVRQWLAGDV